MGGSNATITPGAVFVPGAGSAPSASLQLVDSNGHAVDTAATASYFVNPLNLATDPITGDINWASLGTRGMFDLSSGSVRLSAPQGAVNPSWIVDVQIVYQPNDQVTDRIIEQIVLSTANENGNSTGTPVGTVFAQSVLPFNGAGPDPAQLHQVESRFTIVSPGAVTGDPIVLYPAFEHTGTVSTAPTLFDLTLNVLYVGDVPNYQFVSAP